MYLVQGQSDRVRENQHLAYRASASAIFLTYDEPLEGAMFFPNSTWSEGRNKTLEHALEKEKYSYYIFCDDDIAFESGGWDVFESQILALRPAIAVPVCPKTFETHCDFSDASRSYSMMSGS